MFWERWAEATKRYRNLGTRQNFAFFIPWKARPACCRTSLHKISTQTAGEKQIGMKDELSTRYSSVPSLLEMLPFVVPQPRFCLSSGRASRFSVCLPVSESHALHFVYHHCVEIGKRTRNSVRTRAKIQPIYSRTKSGNLCLPAKQIKLWGPQRTLQQLPQGACKRP